MPMLRICGLETPRAASTATGRVARNVCVPRSSSNETGAPINTPPFSVFNAMQFADPLDVHDPHGVAADIFHQAEQVGAPGENRHLAPFRIEKPDCFLQRGGDLRKRNSAISPPFQRREHAVGVRGDADGRTRSHSPLHSRWPPPRNDRRLRRVRSRRACRSRAARQHRTTISPTSPIPASL